MMQDQYAEVGWTENQWSTVLRTVEEEAQKARIGRRFLPIVGPLSPEVTAVPRLLLTTSDDPNQPRIAAGPPPTGFVPTHRLEASTDPTLYLATISVLVELPKSQVLDPNLSGALTIFRRAANYIARLEDALIINGQPERDEAPPLVGVQLAAVFRVTGGGANDGLFPSGGALGARLDVPLGLGTGTDLVTAVVNATVALEAAGQFGPFHCIFSPQLQSAATAPNASFIMARDRILPHLEGGSVFSSTLVPRDAGAVVATNGNPIELVVGSDICVKFLQTTLEPRWVFRVSERIVLRIKEMQSIAIIR
jgi:uncharacterized linocin/CFP29 family protein